MTSGRTLHTILSESGNRLDGLLDSGASDAEIVNQLYWSALTREPRDAEATQIIDYLGAAEDRRKAVEDLVWALINSKEFMLRK